MNHTNKALLLLIIVLIYTSCSLSTQEKDFSYRPNILWIVAEDMSDHWSCYGETTIQTPNIDKLAAEGELFENAFITSPVCSPSRSAMITGMYQTTTGTHNHRSQRIKGKGGGNEAYYDSYQLPEEVPFLPELFKKAGYYTVLGDENTASDNQSESQKLGKTDYNFEWDRSWYDANDWKGRRSGQPFFAQIQLKGGKFRNAQVENPVDTEEVRLPPYYPDDEVMRIDWAEYLNSILHMDQKVKEICKRLETEGISDSTAIFLFTDHGISHLRGKQFLYEEGIKIPLIVKWPELMQTGRRRKNLVSHLDITATSLYLAGIPIPEVMQGQSFYGENYRPRQYVFAARDRCDETVDLIRAVRTNRFKYIRNFFPYKPHAQPNMYKDGKKIVQHMRQLYADDRLKKKHRRYFEPFRPVEELYDLKTDPYEMHNLARDTAYQDTLQKMRNILMSTIYDTQDLGFVPELIAEELGKQYGNKYYILQQPENRDLFKECIGVMELDEQKDTDGLQQALIHERASIRFWAAYGLGNIPETAGDAVPLLQIALYDKSDAVKIASARALCRLDHPEPALQILADHLDNPNLIVGLYAALFIEDLDESLVIRILPAIENAKDNPYNFIRRVAIRLSQKYQVDNADV